MGAKAAAQVEAAGYRRKALYDMRIKRRLLLLLAVLGALLPAMGQTTVFNCASFAATGACSTAQAGFTGNFLVRNGGNLAGNQIDFVPANSGHNGYGLWYYTQVNVQSFQTTFTFIPNGQNFSFVVQNTSDQPGYQGNIFSSGAGCEAGIYQAFVQPPALVTPNNLFALEFDSGSWLTLADGAFTYSSVQIYQANQSPCLPNDNGPGYVPINKISTYPVALNSPANAQYTTTGDVYSATVTYDGATLRLSLYDVTAGGACPGASCFTQSWRADIPTLVAGNTAYVGFAAGINIPNLPALWVNTWSYAQGAAAPPTVAVPTFSPSGGAYTAPQNVTISDTTANCTIYYTTDGTVPTTASSVYGGPVTVSASESLKAFATASGDTNSAVASATFTITPVVVATPVISPGGGTFTTTQTVSISDSTSGASIYYTTDGTTPSTSSLLYSGPITVDTSETVKAIAAAAGDTNSSVAQAAYTISQTTATPTFSPAAGTYSTAQSVTIADITAGAAIYYTTDGTVPTTSSTLYSGPIAVGATETLEAIAVAAGDSNSAVASAAYSIGSAPQTTNIAIGTTVQQAGVKRLGINLGGQNFYDSGQLSRNLTVRNPGFEAEIWSSILNCQSATATTCIDADQYAVWPANFLQGATFRVLYGAAKGQSGTVAASTAASGTTGVMLTFASPLSPAPAAGDVVKVQMQVPGNPQAGWWVNPAGGATFSADTTDLSPETPGKQALSINAAASGQSAQVSSYFDSYAGRSFVQLNGTYTLSFRAKAVSGSNQINVSFSRIGTAAHGNVSYLNQNVSLTNQWQDYSYQFNAAEDGTYVGTAALTFNIAGAQVYLDDVALTEPAASSNPTVFRNAVVSTLRALQPGVLRYMDGGADFASTTDNMLAVPFARQRAGYGEGQTEQDDISIGLHDFLVLCQAVGAEPWYTVPAGISSGDMQDLIQYLAGDPSTSYGAIRASLGQQAAWTTVFPTIHLELGNEMWNAGSFAGEAVPNAAAYGGMVSTAFAAARASSSYDPSKFDLVMDSWAISPSWTSQEMANSSGYDSVDAAPYLFNSLNDYGSNEAIFGPMFAQPEQVDSSPTASGNYMYQQAQAVGAANSSTKLAVYEVNLSTNSGTAGQSVVTQTAAGLGAGLAVADHMLLMMRDLGITTQNMFALPEYANAFNNRQGGTETTPLWGSVIDMGGETNLKRPQFLAEQLANSAILPTMLATTVSGANPTWNQALSMNDQIQLANAHDLQSFAFTDGSHYNVVVMNLSRNSALPVTFSGSNAPRGNVVIGQLTSANLTDNNEGLTTGNPIVPSPTQTNVSNFNPATPYPLPPYSMTVFSWPGAALPESYSTLQTSPTTAVAGQVVTLTATVSSQSGTTTPTGTITFLNGASTLGTATLNGSGVTSMTTATLPVGNDTITARYGGDPEDASSVSEPVNVTITSGTVASTTALNASAAAISAGQSVTFTATVSPASGTNVPTGTVTFKDGSTVLGTGKLNASGVATFSTTTLAAGTQLITASYGGDGKDYGSISPSVSVLVTAGSIATTTALTASPGQIAFGQSVTFTATVTPQTGTTAPTGTIKFLDGASPLGTATLNASGVATFSTMVLPAGTQSITASYGGDSNNGASVSAAVVVTVTGGTVSSMTALTASATQITLGQSVTFTATVARQSGSGVPTGTITFKNGSANLGTAKLNAGGVATFSTTALMAGTHLVTASYGGDGRDYGSISPTVTVIVTQSLVAGGTTTTSLNASPAQTSQGGVVSFTANVNPQTGNNVPTGLVTFLDGSATLGTANLNAGGMATFSTTSLGAGSHTITASYGGDGQNSPSVSSAVTVTITGAQPGVMATTTTLTASSQQLSPADSVALAASVAPQSGSNVPTGTVTFHDGSTSIGTAQLSASGGATLTLPSLAVGTHSITASYSGDFNDAPSISGALTISVAEPEYAMVVNATSVNLTAGRPSLVTVTLIPENGFNLPISLACSGLPLGTTCAFSPSTVTPNGAPVNSMVTILSPTTSANGSLPRDRGRELALGWVLPLGFLPLIGLATAGRRSRMARWLVAAVLLSMGSLWVSGCGLPATGGMYVVTLTASASNAQTHQTQITVNVQQ